MSQSLKRLSTSIRHNLPFSSPSNGGAVTLDDGSIANPEISLTATALAAGALAGNTIAQAGVLAENTIHTAGAIAGNTANAIAGTTINTANAIAGTTINTAGAIAGTTLNVLSTPIVAISRTISSTVINPTSPMTPYTSPSGGVGNGAIVSASSSTAYPDYIQDLLLHYKQQEKIVKIVEKCREKQALTQEEGDILLKKYEYFLLGSDISTSISSSSSPGSSPNREHSLLSQQQKMNRIIKTIRSNASTIIEELELLAIICKDIYDASRNFTDDMKYTLKPYYQKLQQLIENIFKLRENRFKYDMIGRSDINERTTLVRNFIVSMNNLIETYQSHLNLVFDSHSHLHSHLSTDSNANPIGVGGSGTVMHGLNLTDHLSDDDYEDDEDYDDDDDDSVHPNINRLSGTSALSGDEEAKHPNGDSNQRRSVKLRDSMDKRKSRKSLRKLTSETRPSSIGTRNSTRLRKSTSRVLTTGTVVVAEKKKQVIDLSNCYIESVDLGELNLLNVFFGTNKVTHCNFLFSQITADQLCAVKGISEAILGEDLKYQLIQFKYDENIKILNEMKRIIQEAKDTLRCLKYFPRLLCPPLSLPSSTSTSTTTETTVASSVSPSVLENEIIKGLEDIPLNDLRRIFLMIFTDNKINPLEYGERYNPTWIVEHEQELYNDSIYNKHNLLNIIKLLYKQRHYYLPEEVIALSMDQKIINCTFSIDSPLLYITDIQSSFSFFPMNMIEELTNIINNINELKEICRIEHKDLRQENELQRIRIFSNNLNDRIDHLLGYGPTDRLQHLLEIVRGTKIILDLRNIDLSNVNFMNNINLSDVYISITKEQETKYLTKEHVEQRYSLLYTLVQRDTTTIDDLDYLLMNCHLDVNRPELPDSVCRTVLMHACFLKRMDLVVHLVEKYGARHDIKTKTGWDVISQLCSMRGGSSSGNSSGSSGKTGSTTTSSAVTTADDAAEGSLLSSPTTSPVKKAPSVTPSRPSPTGTITSISAAAAADAAAAIANSKRIDPICLDIAAYLVEHGAFLSVHNAANLGDLKHLKKFHRSELLTCCPATGYSVAHIAARDNNVAILRYLKSKAFDFRTVFENGPTCLWVACDSSSHDAAIELIHFCPELREMPYRSKTPIKVALENKDFLLVKKLKNLSCRADIEVAIALEDDQWIRQHLNDIRNANVKMEQQKLALLYACKYGWEKLVKHLVEECEVDLNDRYSSEQSKRVVDIVCSLGNIKLMKCLMSYVSSKRFNLNEYTTSCPTLLFTAIQYKHWDIVSLILDYKPDLTIKHLNRTPLHALLMVDNRYVKDIIRINIVKKMLLNGVNVLAVDNGGCTALHYAASISEDMVMLILKGYIGHKNKDGKDALDFAQEANQELPSLKL